ncbi:MAG: hypothetical protein ACOX0M_03790 [Salinivirgaceae bacterium]|jgi:hypothetical protein|nr:hypothetical protein [Bacteroidales bacterium]
MRKIVLGLIGFLFTIFSSGQELTVDVEVDTLKVIKTVEIPTKEICFEIPYGKVFISKASIIELWDNELALWKAELDKASQNKDWQIEDYKKSKSYLEFVKRQERLFLKYFSDDHYSLTQQFEERRPETDTLYHMEQHLKEIVCNLLNIGEFEVHIENKRIENVIKAEVRRSTYYNETISTEYIINDSIYFWVCPPIIHSDFDVEPEDFHISKPPKD